MAEANPDGGVLRAVLLARPLHGPAQEGELAINFLGEEDYIAVVQGWVGDAPETAIALEVSRHQEAGGGQVLAEGFGLRLVARIEGGVAGGEPIPARKVGPVGISDEKTTAELHDTRNFDTTGVFAFGAGGENGLG